MGARAFLTGGIFILHLLSLPSFAERLPPKEGAEILCGMAGSLLGHSSMQIVESRGEWVKVKATAWVPRATMAAAYEMPKGRQDGGRVEILESELKSYDRDYQRREKPSSENVSAYFRLRNGTDRELMGVELEMIFLDTNGHTLYSEILEAPVDLLPGESGGMVRMWYAENNEFSTTDPYDILRAAIDSGAVRMKTIIRRLFFADGFSLSVQAHRDPL